AVPRQETPPPIEHTLNAGSGMSAPTRLGREPSSGGVSHSGFAQPVTPYPVPAHRLQPWLIFIGILLVLVLVIGGVLVGLQLNKGTTTINPSTGPIPTANTPHTSNTPVATQITPTSQPSGGSTPTSQPTPTTQ